MNIVASLWKQLFKPPRPTRLIAARRVRLFAAIAAAVLATGLFLVLYYLTLGLLPPASAYPVTLFPVSSWAHRFDLAQFLGSLLRPPYPSPLTWWVGVIVLGGTLTGAGVAYALLLAWAMQRSDVAKGLGFGVALFVGLGMLVWVGNGFHPAIQRNALPDPGFFWLGWSGWATVQMLVVLLCYGATLGGLYQRWTARP